MRLSIIIPCHNAEPYLAQTIGSALDQSSPPDELIVVDDGSTDGSLELAERFAARSPLVRVTAERFGSAAATRNAGARLASGDKLMFLDADDVLAPHALELLGGALNARSRAIAACGWQRLDLRDGKWFSGPASCAARRAGQDALAAWLTGWYYPPCAVLWSREAYEGVGGWDERIGVNDDGDLMMRALASGVALVEIPTVAAFYRRLPRGQVSLSGKRFTREGLASRIAVLSRIANLLEERGRVRNYGAPLAEAFDLIAKDAGDHPEMAEQARELARRHRPNLLMRVRRQGGEAGPGWLCPAPTEIRHGLEHAARILQSRAAVEAERKPEPGIDKRPLVTAIIPTYNRCRLLPRAVESVLAQTFGDFELLIVDDASPDETEAVVSGLNDGRVRYLRQPRNMGVSAARNRGLREARGTYVAFLDDDDEWLPEKLALQVERFEKAPPEVGMIYTGTEEVRPDGSRKIDLATASGDLYRTLLVRNVVHGGAQNAMIRRDVTLDVGFFDEALPAIEDHDYWLRLSRRYRIECISEPLARYYNDGPTEDEVRRSRNIAANLRARAEFFRRYERQMRKAGVAHLYLLESARRHLVPSYRDVRGARRLAMMAVERAPLARGGYELLFRLLIPSQLKRLVRGGRGERLAA